MSRAQTLLESARRISFAFGFGKPHPAPLFVLGNEKSGTTAIAALLARHTGCSVTLDLPGILHGVNAALKRHEQSFQLFVDRNKYDFSKQIIKEPQLTFFRDEIKAVFPKATFLFIVRDPRQNIRSILDRVGLPGTLESLDADRIASVPEDWRSDITGEWLGLSGRHYVEILAARWNLAADVYLNDPSGMTLARYEDFLGDKAGAIARLAQNLKLPAQREVSGEVDTQYQSRGKNRDTAPELFFGPQNLNRIETTCRGRMAKFGYK